MNPEKPSDINGTGHVIEDTFTPLSTKGHQSAIDDSSLGSVLSVVSHSSRIS